MEPEPQQLDIYEAIDAAAVGRYIEAVARATVFAPMLVVPLVIPPVPDVTTPRFQRLVSDRSE